MKQPEIIFKNKKKYLEDCKRLNKKTLSIDELISAYENWEGRDVEGKLGTSIEKNKILKEDHEQTEVCLDSLEFTFTWVDVYHRRNNDYLDYDDFYYHTIEYIGVVSEIQYATIDITGE